VTDLQNQTGASEQLAACERRQALKKLGRFVAVSAPTVTLLMAARSRPASAAVSIPQSSRQFKTVEGTIDPAVMLAAVTTGVSAATTDPIDGVGMCLAAIKGLVARIDALSLQVAAG
jgi:hypothetical protein